MMLPHSPLPDWLRPSAAVDVAQLWFGVRPAIRTELRSSVGAGIVFRWARRYKFFCALDEDQFLVLSRDSHLPRTLLAMDRSLGNHTYRFGMELGYPRCCCVKAAEVGESQLDEWASRWRVDLLRGVFRLIDPSDYVDGRALISHIPCSPRCQASLKMARMLLRAMKPLPANRWYYSYSFRRQRFSPSC